MNLLLFSLFFLSSLCFAARLPNKSYFNNLGKPFNTGHWTLAEDALIIKYLQKYPDETLPRQKIWLELSKQMNRRPRLIREHFTKKLDISKIHENPEWTKKEDKFIMNAVKIAKEQKRNPLWTSIAKNLHRPRAAVYIRYQTMLSEFISSFNSEKEEKNKLENIVTDSNETLYEKKALIGFVPDVQFVPRRLRKVSRIYELSEIEAMLSEESDSFDESLRQNGFGVEGMNDSTERSASNNVE